MNEREARIARVAAMEARYDRARAALDALDAALGAWEAAREDLRALEAYGESGEWLRDFEADEAGALPDGLKRGVRAEDALGELRGERDELRERLRREEGEA